MNRRAGKNPARIVVLMFGDMGDVLLATPALSLLRESYPDARITAMTKSSTIEVLAGSGLVDSFLPIDKALYDRPSALLHPRVARSLVRSLFSLRRERADTLVILHHFVSWWGTVKFSLLALASGAAQRVGLDNGRGLALTIRARDRGYDAASEWQYWLEVIQALSSASAAGVNDSLTIPHHPVFVVPLEAETAVSSSLRAAGIEEGDRLLAIHPGSGPYSVARRWAPERFARVADTLARRHGLRVILVGGPEEQELAETVATMMEEASVNLAGRTGLAELAALLRRCVILVGNDSGVAHLSSAVETPVVAIFGPFNSTTWRPMGRTEVVRAEPPLPCMPCVNRGFSRGYPEGCPPRYCLQEIRPAAVTAAAERLLRSEF